jgi:hypothetical protein
MKVKTSIKHGTKYVYAKLGSIVVAIQQVAIVNGLAMWEVERVTHAGPRKRLIVSARALMPIPAPVGAN